MNVPSRSQFWLKIQAIFPWFRVEFLIERIVGGKQDRLPVRDKSKILPKG
jgi:hypothetical protein